MLPASWGLLPTLYPTPSACGYPFCLDLAGHSLFLVLHSSVPPDEKLISADTFLPLPHSSHCPGFSQTVLMLLGTSQKRPFLLPVALEIEMYAALFRKTFSPRSLLNLVHSFLLLIAHFTPFYISKLTLNNEFLVAKEDQFLIYFPCLCLHRTKPHINSWFILTLGTFLVFLTLLYTTFLNPLLKL